MDRKSFRTPLILFLPVALVFLTAGVCPLRAEDEPDTPPERQPEESMTQYNEGFFAHRIDGELPEAASRLRRARNLDDENWRALYELGKVYYARGDNDSAVQVWEEGLEAPDRYRSWFQRELASHRLRYEKFLTSPASEIQWTFSGQISGDVLGRRRNINPAALAKVEDGGVLSASYGTNRVIEYSKSGRISRRWGDFSLPLDMAWHPRLGHLVAEYDGNRISLLSPAGDRREFASRFEDPRRILTDGRKIFAYSDGRRELIQLNTAGETVVVTWSAPTGSRIEDLTIGPEGNFWIVESRGNRLIEVNQRGEKVDEYHFAPRREVRRIWWAEEELLLATERALVNYDFEAGFSPLEVDGDIIEGASVSDILFYGDRLYISRFEESDILIYRTPRQPEPDILIQDRRYHFENYPIIRLNLIVDDPLRSDRFRDLKDRDLGIRVEGREARPSFLRPTRDIFSPAWFLLVDNRFQSEALWEEMRQYLEEIIARAPEDSRGSVIDLGQEETRQGLTDSAVQLRDALNSILPAGEPDLPEEDPVLDEYLDRLFDLATSRRGPVGIILFSPHLEENREQFERFANRARNNKVPLIVISPSSEPLSEGHHFRQVEEILLQDFTNLEAAKAWRFYNRNINRHLSAVFRSPIAVLEHAEWRDLELEIHYFDRVYEFDGGYLLP